MRTFTDLHRALALLLLWMAASYAQADDAINLEVTGTIVAQPCNITWPDSVVDLGSWPSVVLNGQGANAGTAPHLLSMAFTQCPMGTSSASVTFTGTPDSAMPDTLFANTAGVGGAQDVGLRLYRIIDGTQSLIVGNNTVVNVPLTAGEGILELSARMMTPNGTSTAGSFRSVVTLNVTWQ